MNPLLSPLTFVETLMPRPWGGRRLETLFGKRPPPGVRIGEVWLIADHARCESVVESGPFAGQPIGSLVQMHREILLGRIPRLTAAGRFPLMLKLIDVAEWLSVQVHPSDADAERLGERDGGKTEMWHVLSAARDAEILCGATVDSQWPQGRAWLDCIERFRPAAGESYFVPPGTVHAIGPGLVIAEIQQTSDITYRLFDWDRDAGADRPLHLEKAAQVLRGNCPQGPVHAARLTACSELLCACTKFAAERVRVETAWTRTTRGDSFHVLLNIGLGALRVETEDGAAEIAPGSAALIPGANERFSIVGTGTILDYYVPDLALDVIGPLNAAGVSEEQIEALSGQYAEYSP